MAATLYVYRLFDHHQVCINKNNICIKFTLKYNIKNY
jgi:hypothetical protein